MKKLELHSTLHDTGKTCDPNLSPRMKNCVVEGKERWKHVAESSDIDNIDNSSNTALGVTVVAQIGLYPGLQIDFVIP